MRIFGLILLLTLAAVTLQQDEDIVFEQQFVQIQQPEPTPTLIPQSSRNFTHDQLSHPSPSRPPLKFNRETFHMFRYQILGIAVIFFYLLMFVRGKKANVEIMQKFYRKVDGFLEDNFAHIGFSRTSGEVPFNGQSPSESMYYATGRENVDYIEMRFNTKKRHDLLYTLYDIISPERDTVTLDIPIKTQIQQVFLVAQKKRVKEIKEAHLDIRKITGNFNIVNLNAAYEVFGESAQTLDNIIDKYVVKRLNDMNGLFISIHFTDLHTFSSHDAHLRVVLNTTHKTPEHFLPAMELVFYLVDKLAGLKLTVNAKAKAQKARQIYNQSKEKENLEKHNEEMKKKKQDKLREQQAWLRSLPPDRQKKEEEKRKKKQFNKLMKGKTLKM